MASGTSRSVRAQGDLGTEGQEESKAPDSSVLKVTPRFRTPITCSTTLGCEATKHLCVEVIAIPSLAVGSMRKKHDAQRNMGRSLSVGETSCPNGSCGWDASRLCGYGWTKLPCLSARHEQPAYYELLETP